MLWLWALVLSLAVSGSAAEPLELLSVRHPALPASVGGNGDSVEPVVTPDGRFVLFASTANNLVTNDDAQFGMDVFLHDRESGRTTLVSVNTNGTGGGDGHSLPGMVSTNGRYVVFESTSLNLAPLKTNAHADVFLRDMETGMTRLISRRPDGRGGNHVSRQPVISPDGAWIAFASEAWDLVANDTNSASDVFLHSVTSGTLERMGPAVTLFASAARIGASEPSFSAEGTKLLFVSDATNLVDGVSANKGELYLLNLATRELTWASSGAADLVFTDTNRLNAITSQGALSADGRWLAFRTGLLDSPINAWIFHRDLLAAAPVVVTTNSLQPRSRQDEIYAPKLSADGRFVAYVEAGETPGSGAVVRRWDAQSGSSVPVSVGSGGEIEAGSHSTSPEISADGRFVAHLSTATNLAAPTHSSGLSLYRHDLGSGEVKVTRVGSAEGYRPVIRLSADGEWTFFHSKEALSDEPTAGRENVFAQLHSDPVPRLVSRSHETLTNAPTDSTGVFAGRMTLSVDGRWVAFASHADDLVAADNNGQMDVFVFDRARGRTRLVSAGADGFSARGGASYSPKISGNGRYVAFLSMASNLVGFPVSTNVHLYRHDLFTGGTELVSVSTNGSTPFLRDVSEPSISHEGRYLAYSSQGLGTPSFQIQWRDMETNLAVTVAGTSTLNPPSMSTNGLELAHVNGTSIRVWNALSRTNQNVSGIAGTLVLSPDGGRLLVHRGSSVASTSLRGTGSHSITGSGIGALQGQQHWNGAGTHFLVVTRQPLVSDDNNSNDVFLCSATNGTNRVLLSRKLVSNSAGNGASDSPAFSADGRFVVFRTWATDIVPVSGPGPHLVLHDGESGTNRLVTPDRFDGRANGYFVQPLLSGSGETLLFTGWRPDMRVGRGLNALAVAFSPLDDDRDGLLDDWERLHFQSLGRNGELDADQDGLIDREEYLAGTDPNDQDSKLGLVVEGLQAGNEPALKLRWPASVEAVSRLQFTEDLSEPVWRDLPGTRRWMEGWLEQELADPGTATNGFFRVRVAE